MPQETEEAAQYMTVTQPDGTVIGSDGVILPGGKRMSRDEHDRHREDEDAADKAADEAMREETTRSGKKN